MSGDDGFNPENFEKIAGEIARLHEPRKSGPLPWTEEELYGRAFLGDEDTFPIDLEGQPIACDSVFEGGERLAAMALLGVALTENLSSASLATLRHFYDAINPDAVRGEHKLTLQLRYRGRGRPSVKAKLRQTLDDSLTAKLVEFAERNFGKKEAAVAYIAELKGVSRANVFRALARHSEFLDEEKSQQSED